MKTFITAMLAAAGLVGAASADTTGAYTVISSGTGSIGDYVTWSLQADGSLNSAQTTWLNEDALVTMNNELGINASTDDLSDYYYGNSSTTRLTLTFSREAYSVGDEVTFYLLIGTSDEAIQLYIDARYVTSFSFAFSSDSGFYGVDFSSATIISASYGTVLVKVTAELSNTDDSGNYVVDVEASAGGDIGFGLVAVSGAAAVPEPATATLSLLALAGLAARRRRK